MFSLTAMALSLLDECCIVYSISCSGKAMAVWIWGYATSVLPKPVSCQRLLREALLTIMIAVLENRSR
jgi:hypothetical protein